MEGEIKMFNTLERLGSFANPIFLFKTYNAKIITL